MRTSVWLAIAGTAVVPGCGGAPEMVLERETSFVRGGSGSASVTYQPSVRLWERNEGLALLEDMSTDGATIVFEAGRRELAGLQAGDVLVVKDLLARKVIAADTVDGRLYVLTTGAALGEVVRTGRIALDVPVRFTPAVAGRSAASGWFAAAGLAVPELQAEPRAPEQANEADPGSFIVEGEFEGWTTAFTATPAPGRINITLTLTREVGGFRAVIAGDGYVADFDLSSRIDMDDGIIQRLQMAYEKLNGLMNFRWEVSKDTPGAEARNDRIKLPGALAIPLAQFVGGLPLYLEISAAMILQPALSGGKEYSRGAFRATFDGTQGFVVQEGTIDADGSVTGTIDFVEGQNISMLAPHAMVVAFAAPRIELTFGPMRALRFGAMKDAAKRVDEIADRLARVVLSADDYRRLKSSPMGGFKLGTAVSMAMKSDAAAYVELVTTAGTSFSGMSAIFPCTRTDLEGIVKVGVGAQAFGQSFGHLEQEVFSRRFERVDPPDLGGLCERAGQ